MSIIVVYEGKLEGHRGKFVRLEHYRALQEECLEAEALCDALQRKLDAIEADERLQ